MRRRIRKFVGSLYGPKKVVFFVVIILVCVVALLIGLYAQYDYKYSETDPLMIGINIAAVKNDEQINDLKTEFKNLFDNTIKINSENVKANKIEPSNDLVYTGNTLENEDENYYQVKAFVPVININSDTAKKMNGEIQSEFVSQAKEIMGRRKGRTVYTVDYCAFVNQDVLSVVIKSNLKEDDKPEKVTVKTYNYVISENRELTFEELIKLKETTFEEVQNTINRDIEKYDTNAKILAADYGATYVRDLKSDMYSVENTSTFFLTQDGYVYIVYAYGNIADTNEIDLVIF